ncbi:hypothetical protein NC651_001166 [Populus alba x Populus x berolinensis]|nr:hypothetical protein NC651_001166 [Populus alba x Populus x berolinensis]
MKRKVWTATFTDPCCLFMSRSTFAFAKILRTTIMVSGGRAGQEDNAYHHHLEATLPVRILMLTLPVI